MAKDDYDVIVYKVLVYYYACFKQKIIFEEEVFKHTVSKDIEKEEYLIKILLLMQTEGLITGLSFTKAWGGDYILINDLADAEITAEGIHYLKDNSKMKAIGESLKEAVDLIAKLAVLVL